MVAPKDDVDFAQSEGTLSGPFRPWLSDWRAHRDEVVCAGTPVWWDRTKNGTKTRVTQRKHEGEGAAGLPCR